MRIILHIGTDKTGSTAIQRHIALNLDWLASRSVFIPFPDLHRGSGQAALLDGLDAGRVAELERQLAWAESRGFEQAILSWEGMNFYPPKKIRFLSAVLSGYDLSVLIYLREQADLIQSGLLQQYKTLAVEFPVSAIHDPRSLAEKRLVKRQLTSGARNYHRLIRRWKRCLPAAQIAIRIYDPQLLVNNNVVDDFFSHLGLAADHNFRKSSLRLNTSLDVESALLISRWQQNGERDADLQRKVDIALSVIANEGAGSRYFLTEEEVMRVRKHFRPSNERLATDFLPSLKYPFPHELACWRTLDYSAITDGAETRAHRIAEIDGTPTLSPTHKDFALPAELDLENGWQQPEKWGVWSGGAISKIRFRVWRREITLGSIGIKVFIRGRYYGDNSYTTVIVNGRNFGDARLDRPHPGFVLSNDILLPYEMVEITLRHASPVSPGRYGGPAADDREIAFGLVSIGYDYLWKKLTVRRPDSSPLAH